MSANDVIDYLMRDPRALTEALGSARGTTARGCAGGSA